MNDIYKQAAEVLGSIDSAQDELSSIDDAMQDLAGRIDDLRSDLENIRFDQDSLLDSIDSDEAADSLAEIVRCIFDVKRGIADMDELVALAEAAPVTEGIS
jgi:hypothetical protein